MFVVMASSPYNRDFYHGYIVRSSHLSYCLPLLRNISGNTAAITSAHILMQGCQFSPQCSSQTRSCLGQIVDLLDELLGHGGVLHLDEHGRRSLLQVLDGRVRHAHKLYEIGSKVKYQTPFISPEKISRPQGVPSGLRPLIG